MNEQLKRIRQKDYSAIDQKLFQNMSRAENLSSTISHLSQFQRFLMEQITNLNQPAKVTANSNIANSISKNFQTLKESLVKCSRAIGQNERKSIVNLKKTLTSLQSLVKDLKNEIYQQIKFTCKKVQDQAKMAMENLLTYWSKQKTLKDQYFNKCKVLEGEKAKLLKQIEEIQLLTQKNSNTYEIQSIYTENSIEILNKRHFYNAQKIVTQFKTETQSGYTPLREQALNQTTPYEDRSWKLPAQKLGNNTEDRRGSISRQNSNHRLNSKPNANVGRQNELLLKKGVKQQRGKSRQKIKLVSMM